MDGYLNLIKTDFKETEKRVFPRFPFSYMTFKLNVDGKDGEHAFEVMNISYTGMQLSLKSGGCSLKPEQGVMGSLHWKKANLEVESTVKWVKGNSLGLAFVSKQSLSKISDFLSIENIMEGMHPVHDSDLGLEIPANLKYWLRADGPIEIFVWQHKDREISRFQVILLDKFVEWEDGKGIRTGNVVARKDLETPLGIEDEFTFEIDGPVDNEKLQFATRIIKNLPENYLPNDASEFLYLKLGN